VKLPETESLGDQLKRNAATLVICVICLIGVLIAAFKPPTEEVRRLSRQLAEERSRLEAKAADDEKAQLRSQTELKETQRKLTETEKALSDNEDALRQTEAALSDFTSPRKPSPQVQSDEVPARGDNKAKLKTDLMSVRDALREALGKLQSDNDAFSVNSKGLAMEKKSLDEVSNSYRVLKGEISANKADSLKRDLEDYLPHPNAEVVIIVGDKSASPAETLLAEVDKAASSDDPVLMQKALQSETGELGHTVEQIRTIEADILRCQQQTVELQHSILARQDDILALQKGK
jgi:DNA repair exonuclease SbcCD ATPase subunit